MAIVTEKERHTARFALEGERFTFECTCGVGFVVRLHSYVVAGVERTGWRVDPSTCPRALSALEGHTPLPDWERRHALREVAAWVKPSPAAATTPVRAASDRDSVKAARAALRAERVPNAKPAARSAEPKGGGHVSRPPQSALDKRAGLSYLGSPLVSDRLLSMVASLGNPNATQPDGSPTPAGDAERHALMDAVAEKIAARIVGEASPRASGHASSAPRGDESPAAAESSGAGATPILLDNAVDTLEVGWMLELDPADVKTLQDTKKKVQDAPKDGPESLLELWGVRWKLEPKGSRFYQFILTHERGMLLVSQNTSEDLPPIAVKLYSETLHVLGLDDAWAWMEGIARAAHKPEGASEEAEKQPDPDPHPRVSRVDLAADFKGLSIEAMDPREFVVRARHKGFYRRTEEGYVLVRNRDGKPATIEEKDDLAVASFESGLHATGIVFGKSSLATRIYDKPREIREQSPDKVWLFDKWMRCAACGEKAIDHEAALLPRDATLATQKDTIAGRAGCERTKSGEPCLAFVEDEAGYLPERACPSCEGSGKVAAKVKCKACRGGKRKRLTCCACNKTGQEPARRKCHPCGGKGSVSDEVARVEAQCRREFLRELCKGVERTCDKCDGLGQKTDTKVCRSCKGKGTHRCSLCRRRKRPNPACEECQGEGSSPCKPCGETGAQPVTRVCKKCRAAEGKADEPGLGWRLEKPDPRELADPRTGLVVARGGNKAGQARNVGEDLDLAIDSLAGLKAALPVIWRYVVGGGKGVRPWLAWRTPTSNPQRTRWPLRPEWLAVQGVDWAAKAAPVAHGDVVRLKRKRAKFKKLIPIVAGTISTAVALRFDEDEEELTSADKGVALVTKEILELYAKREEIKPETGWAGVVSLKLQEHGAWGLLGEQEMERQRATA